ncbi:hypothetical protein IJ670_08705, partial [bacterium]|nr:hypothetical protein [bacterium]
MKNNNINLIIQKSSNMQAKNILAVGVFHGDEGQGEFFINSYLQKYTQVGKNSLYFIPRLNFSSVRKNPNGVDLNRNFPTKNWQKNEPESDYFSGDKPMSEKEVEFIVDLMNKVNF